MKRSRTHPTISYLLVEHYLPEVMVTPDDGENPTGAQAYCTPNGGWGEYIMRFENLESATIGHMTEDGLEGWIYVEGTYTRRNTDDTIEGSGWIYGPYIYENFGTSWVPQLSSEVAVDTISNLPGCELAVATQVMDIWENAINLWETTPESGKLSCETRSRYLVGTDTYVSILCTSSNQRPVSFQFQNQGPEEINQIVTDESTSYELVWIFTPEGPNIATGRVLAFDADGHLEVLFAGLSPYEYWVARD